MMRKSYPWIEGWELPEWVRKQYHDIACFLFFAGLWCCTFGPVIFVDAQ